MTYQKWYNQYIEPTIVPTGKGNWQTDDAGKLIITRQIPKGTRNYHTMPKGRANSVVMHYGKAAQWDYDLYDENGFIAMQIHCGDHGMPKKHTFGEFGEHAAPWIWEKVNQKWRGHPDKNRELTDKERR